MGLCEDADGGVYGFSEALSTVGQWHVGASYHCGARVGSVSWCVMNFASTVNAGEHARGRERMKFRLSGILSTVLLSAMCATLMAQAPERWTEEKANAWYAQQPGWWG